MKTDGLLASSVRLAEVLIANWAPPEDYRTER